MYTAPAPAPATRAGRSSTLANIIRWLWRYRERRFERIVQQRNEWIYEAQHAPTVQEWIDREWIASQSRRKVSL